MQCQKSSTMSKVRVLDVGWQGQVLQGVKSVGDEAAQCAETGQVCTKETLVCFHQFARPCLELSSGEAKAILARRQTY